jgi:T5SS/PEP-CTERM-associated repeat protein
MKYSILEIICFGAVLFLVVLPTRGWAATKTWNSAASTDWFAAGNWTGGVPGLADTAVINLGASGPIVTAAGAVASTVEVGTTAAGGTLGVQSGGGLSDTTGYIGFNAGSSGTATVTGAGSSWANSGNLRVGSSGNGTLNVQSGGAVSDVTGYIGFAAGSTSTVTVTDSGSSWTNSGNMEVGNGGNGTLNVQSGGVVSDVTGYIGFAAGSTRTVTVTGSGSSWTNSGNLIVGNSGSGTLDIESSGTVSDVSSNIGYAAGSTGSATVSGAGSSWTNSGTLNVGSSGSGTLDIESSGTVSDVSSSIGSAAGSTGTATVSGSGSSWTNSGNLNVGNSGSGTLNVQSGGVVSNAIGTIGSASGSTGSATVTGSGSSWTSSSLRVGLNGSGTLDIESSGTVSDAAGTVGSNAGSAGTATVNGSGSSWSNSGNLTVGNTGNGTLNVESGGAVSDVTGDIGFAAVSTSTVTVTDSGSSWTNSGTLYVGNSGNGTLNIENGAAVSSVGTYIASSTGSSGTAVVSGSGSTWNNTTGSVNVGRSGNGALTIESGGAVNGATGNIGLNAGSTGTATVSGTGSTWTSSGNFAVGSSGNGTLNVRNSGNFSSSSDINVGAYAGSNGILNVSDGGTVTAGHQMHVGEYGAGTMTVSGGGIVTSENYSRIGGHAGAEGSATISGVGSAWISAADLAVGDGGAGTLTVANGGSVTAGSGIAYADNNENVISTGTVYIANQIGSSGTLNIGAAAGQAAAPAGTLAANTVAFGQGTGTLVFNHTSANYVFAPTITGNGVIDVISGTTILTGGFSDFTGSIYMTPGNGVGLTTLASQEDSVQALGSDMRAMAIEERSTANALLGLTRSVDNRNYLFYGALLGSSVVYAGGQRSMDRVTLLGGVAEGKQEYPGIRASAAPTVAAALRYTFDDPFGHKANALHPYGEIGGWAAPNTDISLSRTYLNGSGLAMGQGDTNARSWAEYGRAGLVWNATSDDHFTGYGEVGQQFTKFNGYAEDTDPANPFPVTVGGGLFRMSVARIGGSWTHDVQDPIDVPASITLAGDAARSFDVHSGLTATEPGIGGMNAANASDTWGEFGARFEIHVTKQSALYIDLTGTTGGGGIGTALHGGGGITYSF